MSDRKTCFVIMPFVPELHYFFLYLQEHYREAFLLQRADDETRQEPFLDKIKDHIQKADVVIADCSGNNPNVMYELGIAHALNKKVILLSQDSADKIPSDIKHYEFILYQLDKHDEFLRKLDNALQNAFSDEKYEVLYQQAEIIFREFERVISLGVKTTSKEVFTSLVKAAERTQGLPDIADEIAVREFVLPKIIANIDNHVMTEIISWLAKQ